jgi:LysR family glycine cleavage system transcriptional activator
MEKQWSLDSLRLFAVAARHCSFTNAAKELQISQSAVSQQINKLEKAVGFALFTRKAKGLELTEKGLRLHDAVRDALGRLEHTLQELRESRLREALTVRTLPSIAVKWFLPRLTKLRQWAPELTIAVDAELALPDFLGDGIDVAIAYGKSDHPEWDQTFLFEDAIFPVCAPSFLAAHPMEKPTDLHGHFLLHDSVPHGIYSTSWDAWFAKLGLTMPQDGTGPAFSTAALVSESAVAGQGVALTRYSLVADHLAAGQLVRLFDTVLYEDGFYLVCPKIFLKRAAIRKFYEWACKEAAAFKEGMKF